MSLRPCRDDERDEILEIINGAAIAYRGVIPADRWHEPYMEPAALDREIVAGVRFWGCADGDRLLGVMGVQRAGEFALIRHAYVRPDAQRDGIGTALLDHLRGRSDRRLLVGTWADATWAIAFYERHGFGLVTPEQKSRLLRTHWDIPERQVETSVVLASPSLPDP